MLKEKVKQQLIKQARSMPINPVAQAKRLKKGLRTVGGKVKRGIRQGIKNAIGLGY